jgi:hypothetical protein
MLLQFLPDMVTVTVTVTVQMLDQIGVSLQENKGTRPDETWSVNGVRKAS